MKHAGRSITIAVLALFVIMPAATAHASINDYLNDAVAGVAEDSVYIASEVVGSDLHSEAELVSGLTDSDNIILVALPEEAASTIRDPEAFVNTLGDTLAANDDTVVLGVMIGNEGYGYSNYLTDVVVDDRMTRAESVATNPVEALNTFTQNVHSWQVRNPTAVPTVEGGGFPAGVGVGAVVGIVLLVVIPVFWWRRRKSDSSPKVRFRKTPKQLRPIANEILELSRQIRDIEMRDAIREIIVDYENLFSENYQELVNIQSDREAYQGKLNQLHLILEQYIRIQNSPDYLDQRYLLGGKQAVLASAKKIRKVVSNYSHQGLRDYLGASELLGME